MTAGQWLRLLLVGLGTSIVPLDTAVNIAFPDITKSFGFPIEMIQWLVICYVLTYASLLLAFGRVGDIFSHGWVFRAGLGWSIAAFLLCAAAPAYGWLLLFRFLQGIGAGLVISVAPALVTSLFPEERRARAVAAFTMMFAIGSAAGPLIGGVLVQHWGWPAVFWFRAPIAATALLFLRGLPAGPRPGAREPLDILGAILLAVGISTLLLTLNELQHFGRHDHLALPLCAVAVASLFGFARWESGVARPIVNLAVFRIAGFALVNVASVLIYLTSFSVLLFVPYYLVRFTGLSLAAAGAVLALSFAGMMAASPIAGLMIERVPAGRVAMLGALLGGAGLILIGSWDAGSPGQIAVIVSTLLLQGFGMGLFQVAYTDTVMGTIPRQHRGIAGSLAMLTRTLGIVGGATLLTLVFHAVAAAAATNGHDASAGFLTAFRATFRLAGVVSALTGVAVALAARARPRGSPQ